MIIQPSARCPKRHILGPNEVLVGHQACLGHGGGHTTWTCHTCDQTVYGPPLNTHCTTLDGPTTVRLSNQRYPQRDYEHPPEVELRLSGDLFGGNPRGLLNHLGLYGRPMGDNRWMVRPNEEKSFFRSFDLADETGSPGKSVDIGDSSNTETDARL